MKYVFRLYVTARTPNSLRAIENLTKLCEDELGAEFELRVIDVLDEPKLAEEDKIVAVPTAVRASPAPQRRVIGDLSRRERVLRDLEIGVAGRSLRYAQEG